MPRVTEIVAPFRGSKRRVVSIDGIVWRPISSDVLRVLGVRQGLETSLESLSERLKAEEPVQARARAFRLLRYKERSSAELRGRLVEDGYAERTAGAVVRDLQGSGLVDDVRYAAVLSRMLVQVRGLGRARVLRELAAKGIDEATALEAVDAELTPGDEREHALALTRALVRAPSPRFDKAVRRLVRKGYSLSVALDTVREVFSEDSPYRTDESAIGEADEAPDLR